MLPLIITKRQALQVIGPYSGDLAMKSNVLIIFQYKCSGIVLILFPYLPLFSELRTVLFLTSA